MYQVLILIGLSYSYLELLDIWQLNMSQIF